MTAQKSPGYYFPVHSQPLNPVRSPSSEAKIPALVQKYGFNTPVKQSAEKILACDFKTPPPGDAMPPLTDVNENFLDPCTCKRRNYTILCKICGSLMNGRIMLPACPVHPRVYHLMDYSHCPKCHGTALKEFVSPKKLLKK